MAEFGVSRRTVARDWEFLCNEKHYHWFMMMPGTRFC
jgi:hypothetical protein